MRKNRKRQNLFIYTSLLAIAVLLVLGFLYRNNQYGSLKVNTLEEEVKVFIDNERKESDQDINPEFKLIKGERVAIISKDGFWPWIKNIEIIKKEEIQITPFFVPQNTSGVMIGKQDPEYWSIRSMFRENLISEEALNVIPEGSLKEKIKAINFYKDRQDVVIVASLNGVFALEITETEATIQNLHPIYKGQNPTFVKKDDNYIYILDNNNLMMVNY